MVMPDATVLTRLVSVYGTETERFLTMLPSVQTLRLVISMLPLQKHLAVKWFATDIDIQQALKPFIVPTDALNNIKSQSCKIVKNYNIHSDMFRFK
jgi:hypothetical protein